MQVGETAARFAASISLPAAKTLGYPGRSAACQEDKASESREEAWKSVSYVAASGGPSEPSVHAAEPIIVETIGRRSGKRRRVPVGFLEENGILIVVAEDGRVTSWVRNALDRDGRLRIFFLGKWRDAHLELRPGDPETYLRRMSKAHAAFVRMELSAPELVEITPE